MACLQASADSIRAAICSTSTCTPATVAVLSELLLLKSNVQTSGTAVDPKKPNNFGNNARSKSTKTTVAKSRSKRVDQEVSQGYGEQLSVKERSILATEIINATLKSLSEAIKAPVPPRRKESSKDLVKASARKTLRRSNSMPQSPLQPRSLNRISSSPNISGRSSRSSSLSSNSSSGHRATAECARVAFACLRGLQASKSNGINLPYLQLENGMSILIGKLISLGLDDLATKELRILKRRLDCPESATADNKGVSKANASSTNTQKLAQLLEFGKEALSGEKLSLAITTQQQILRLMVSSPKQRHGDVALAILQPSHPSSPTRALLLAAKDSKPDKTARQLQSLSELLLSLTPSISAADDALSTEPRLSVSPEEAIQLQALALHNRLLWWKFAGHKGDLARDLFDPFHRCLSAFARRSQSVTSKTYHIAVTTFIDLWDMIENVNDRKIPELRKALSGIYRLLGSLAQEANIIDGAITWTEKVQALLDPKIDSDARRSSVVARLVGLKLRELPEEFDEGLILGLLDTLEKPFKGELPEIDDLLTEVSSVRRVAVSILAKRGKEANGLTDGLREICETLVLGCPRFCLRYLGNSPDIKSTTKDILRYEQRRQFIKKLGFHAIDSCLFLIKNFLVEGRLTWNLMDSNLQTCLMLLDRSDPGLESLSSNNGPLPPSYYVRISNLYFSQYLNMRRDSENAKDSQQIQALRRSIDSLQSRPQHEKNSAQFSTKLERMAEFHKINGRFDELFKTLLSLRDESICKGALKTVATAAATNPMHAAWATNEETNVLARTIGSLVKVQFKCLNPAAQTLLYEGPWSEEEKGALLEHLLEVLYVQTNKSSGSSTLQTKLFQASLSLYTRRSYPIRRLRIITRLMSLEPSQHREVSENLSSELCEINSICVEGTKDEGLQSYLMHFQTLIVTLIELQRDQIDIQVLKQCLITWSTIRERCVDSTALKREIDDIPRLVIHLQLIADYMDMKGYDSIRMATLRLIADFNQLRDSSSDHDGLVLCFTRLGSQWLQLGYSGKAGVVFDKALGYSHQNGIIPETLLRLHLSYSEYLLAIGNFDKSEEFLLSAQSMSSVDNALECRPSTTLYQRTLSNQSNAKAHLLYSVLELERGTPDSALTHAKQSVRLLRRAWTDMEKLYDQRTPIDASPRMEVEKLVEEVSQLNMSTTTISTTSMSGRPICGSLFWPLITPLFRSLIHLSNVYAHHGMFQETIYYAEQAYMLVEKVGSEVYMAMASADLGNKWLRAGVLDKGSESLMRAKSLSQSEYQNRYTAALAYHLGTMHGLLGDRGAEIAAYDEAEAAIKRLIDPEFIDQLDQFTSPSELLGKELSKLSLSRRTVPTKQKATGRPKTATKRKTVARAKSPTVEVIYSIGVECPQIISLKGTVIRRKAITLTSMKDYVQAQCLLNETGNYLSTQMDVIEQGLAMARHLLLQSMEQMNADPVYSVLQESTISFPSVIGQARAEKCTSDRLSVAKLSPPRKLPTAKGAKHGDRSWHPPPSNFIEKLRQAQEQLMEVHSIALAVAPVATVHSISALLNIMAMLLSATGQVKGKALAHPGFTSCSTENVRTLVLRRERKAIMADPQTTLKMDDACWPSRLPIDSRRSSLGAANDMAQFQKDYIDIIPKDWTAVSISLSDSRTELLITKLQSGHSPFVLRLPLGRNNSIDADEEVFGFEQGQSELLEVLRLANESAHYARNLIGHEAKTAWWEEREALDARLRDLLENIEKVWLGGFTGIFSQHSRKPELLARFQKSFQHILDKYLPSRQKNGRRNTSPRVTLDSRILDLFIGLGDASAEECDFSEPLTDLLYFVVDVLQFHGELNAYAEVDFDSIVVETHDALRAYHESVKSSQSDEASHTILILDKTLHAFPWESLPCMEDMAVSRLPSFGCLRDRILAQQVNISEGEPHGHYVSRDNGSYILNPGGDLKSTQTTFQKPLQTLSNWNGIIKREPTENEIRTDLETKDILLYFGHGSGAQYIRAREIRKLEKCAVTILMGCSSGSLIEAGDFEPYGPPINYMHAGCPALVATLWDVTDKDIDRFAKSTFEHWGLFGKQSETVGKGKGKTRMEAVPEEQQCSLVEAVAKGRQTCNLRYLTAAAVCVYGIPVYLR